jgi:hypothetical protein
VGPLLHRELTASGKSIIADKTPNNVFIVDRLREAWPDARFIFLLRHPGAIARSRQKYKGEGADELVIKYVEALEAARQTHDGHTVRYEDLTENPERELRRICDFLGVAYEPAMLDYGQSITAATSPASATGTRRSSPAPSSRPSPRRRRGDRSRAARDVREVGLPGRRGPARPRRVGPAGHRRGRRRARVPPPVGLDVLRVHGARVP